MKTNHPYKTSTGKLVAFCIAALVSATSAQAAVVTLSYDWSTISVDQGLQGWKNIRQDTTGTPGFNPYNFDNTRASNQQLGTIAAATGGEAHEIMVLKSPGFQITATSEISFNLYNGAGSGTLVANYASLPTSSSSSGYLGMALMRIDGTYLLDASKSSNGSGAQSFTWDSATLATATSGDSAGTVYYLQFIDTDDGGWGHVSTSFVTLEDVTLAAPEPSSLALLGLGGVLVWARRKQAICLN